MKLLTIVIPSYNSENFIEKCLNSLLLNDEERIEVIIVNDGSMDRTRDLADSYARNYPNIFRCIHKENGGHGSVINVGIHEATGKYFKVLDADDWFDKEILARYLNDLEETDTDVVFTPYVSINFNTGIKIRHRLQILSSDYGKVTEPGRLVRSNWVGLAMVTYKTSLIKNIHVKLDEKTYYEDVEYIQYFLPYAKDAVYYDDYVYQYRTHQTTQSCSSNGMIKHGADHEKVLIHSALYYEKNHDDYISDDIRVCIFYHLIMLVKVQYRIYLSNQDYCEAISRLVEFDRKLREVCPKLFEATNDIDYIREFRSNPQKISQEQMRYWGKMHDIMLGQLGF